MKKYPTILLLLEWYDYRLHYGVSQAAYEFGYQVNCPRNPDFIELGAFKNGDFSGCIALSLRQQTIEALHKKNIPIVELGLEPYPTKIRRVLPDNKKVGEIASEHFREHGYKKILSLNLTNNEMYQERIASLKKFSEKYGASLQVLESNISSKNLFPELESIAASEGKTLKESSLALFALTDVIGSNFIAKAIEYGLKVPENIAVLGVDNDTLLQNSLPIKLSSIDTNPEGIGYKAVEILHKDNLSEPLTKDKITLIKPKGVLSRLSSSIYNVENELVARALNWIHNNFYKGIQAVDVAAALSVSQQGLQRAFAQDHERSPGQEIRYQRVNAVAALLRQTNVQLEEISRSCGFTNPDTLIVNFREQYGITPGKYRKKFIITSH
jgi:LacI family transcriptional regulator